MNLETLQAFHPDKEEHVVLKFRKHWFILLKDSIGTLLLAFLPLLLFPLLTFLQETLAVSEGTISPSLLAFFSSWWILMVWLAFTVIWTNYYLDLWLVTDKRIVSIDQAGLFSRAVTTFPFVNIQDVTVEQRGLIATLLNYGTVTVQTAGPTTNNMRIVGVAHPSRVRDTVVREAEGWRKRNAQK